ncbi:MAG: PQQ-binding-like beta-propeller repeat protein [Terriglobales bacterium]
MAWAALASAAVAVQQVYRVDVDTIFLPLNGVALQAHSGHVAWRFPRYRGQTYTDGHGLLILGWVVALAPPFHQHFTRICRLDTRTGASLWCRDRAGVEQWVVDNDGGYVYVHTRGRLEVLTTAHGQSDRSFDLARDDELTLLPLPHTGLLMLERRRGRAFAALRYQPGAAALAGEPVPATLYPFQGNGRGLLLYARPQHEFFLGAPLRRLLAWHQSGSASFFPRAKLDEHGFIFTDLQNGQPVVRGGTYRGALWQAPRQSAKPQLGLSARVAVMLDGNGRAGLRLRGWDLQRGDLLYDDPVPAAADHQPRLQAADGVLVLQTDTQVCLRNAASGTLLWQTERHEGTLAAVTRTAVVFWEESGEMAALARNNGNLLWRVRFTRAGWALPF